MSDRKAYYPQNRERIRAQQRLYLERNKLAVSQARIQKKYGISPKEFDKMPMKQSGRCKICSDLMTNPHVDHDHETMKVRGLLCSNCNTMIGLAGEDPSVLISASRYLRRSKCLGPK